MRRGRYKKATLKRKISNRKTNENNKIKRLRSHLFVNRYNSSMFLSTTSFSLKPGSWMRTRSAATSSHDSTYPLTSHPLWRVYTCDVCAYDEKSLSLRRSGENEQATTTTTTTTTAVVFKMWQPHNICTHFLIRLQLYICDRLEVVADDGVGRAKLALSIIETNCVYNIRAVKEGRVVRSRRRQFAGAFSSSQLWICRKLKRLKFLFSIRSNTLLEESLNTFRLEVS